MLCGAATSLDMLILRGSCRGWAAGRCSRSRRRFCWSRFRRTSAGMAMAVFGLGVVVAPIIGPTLGGWITDSYSWRWIFYINLPVGMLALFLTQLFIEDPPYIRTDRPPRIDFLGFGLLALWVGCLQIALDRGQQEDWLASPYIRALLIGAVVGLAAVYLPGGDDGSSAVQFAGAEEPEFHDGDHADDGDGGGAVRLDGAAAAVSADAAGVFVADGRG